MADIDEQRASEESAFLLTCHITSHIKIFLALRERYVSEYPWIFQNSPLLHALEYRFRSSSIVACSVHERNTSHPEGCIISETWPFRP